MSYEVAVAYGNEGLIKQTVYSVDQVVVEDEVYFFYDTEGEVLFSAPLLSVVYVKSN
ncbi:MAG: hypothetical protein ABS903_17445 [Solibacillus sp.]